MVQPTSHSYTESHLEYSHSIAASDTNTINESILAPTTTPLPLNKEDQELATQVWSEFT